MLSINDDDDYDSDGTPDDCDACDNDPLKIVEGICGCDVADTDCSYLTLGDVVELPDSCETVCQSSGTDSWAGSCNPVFDPTGSWVDVCSSGGIGLEVNYYAGQEVTGFQFNVSGITVTGASGGSAGDAGFTISTSATTVIGFSLTGATIPAGEGVLVVLEVEGNTDDACLYDLVLSDNSGNAIDAAVEGCTSIVEANDCPEGYDECGVCGGDNSSCEDCAGVPNGDAELDNCGTCDNDPGNDCLDDCNGVPGGDAVEDECGVCDGDDTSCADCAGVPNGDAEFDACGVCGGDGTSCDTPETFEFNISTQQAYYYFNSVTINGYVVDVDDWVGAFNGDICVGARKWDTFLCGNGICDVPVMGDDGSEVTVGYMNTGDFPTFKIYDASENLFYSAQPSEEYPFSNKQVSNNSRSIE